MTINLNGRIDSELLNQFLQAKNSLSEGEKLEVYLCSDGGQIEIAEAFLYEINWHPEDYRLIGYGRLFSSAFDLFFRAKCDKALCGNISGMYHIGGAEITVSETGQPTYTAGAAQTKYLKSLLPQTIALCEQLGFSQSEIKKMKQCHDLYFDKERMWEFLEKSKS